MDTGQRLAAYLSGDLDADERTALEAELAGDAVLRAQLERIRAADQALTDLPEVDLPQGMSDRLDAALAPELERVLGDELAARRARRAMPRWMPATGAAAALVLVVGTGVALVGGFGGGLGDRGEDATMLSAPESAEEDQVRDMMADGLAAGPVVTASGRTLGPDDLAALAADPGLVGPVAPWLVDGDPDAVAMAWRAALGGISESQMAINGDSAPPDAQDDTDGDADRSVSREALPSTLPPLHLDGQVTPDDLDDVARCLGVLFEGATGPVIPLYAELGFDRDGIPVTVYVALSADRTGDLTVVEVWKVDRASCDLREFAQHGG